MWAADSSVYYPVLIRGRRYALAVGPDFCFQSGKTMKNRRDSKAREVDREKRQSGGWVQIGFAIVVFGAVIAAVFLLLGIM